MSNPERAVTAADIAAFEQRWRELFQAQAETALRQSVAIATLVGVVDQLLKVVSNRPDLTAEEQAKLAASHNTMVQFWSLVERTELSDEVSEQLGGKDKSN